MWRADSASGYLPGFPLKLCHAGYVSDVAPVKPPKAYRWFERGLVAGVAAGLAAHSRFPVWALRALFVVTMAWKLSGAVAYAILWLILPRQETVVPIGLVAAARQGLRSVTRGPRWPQILGWAGTLAVALGCAYVMRLYDVSWLGQYGGWFVLLGWGIALVWVTRDTTWPRWAKALVGTAGALVAWTAGTVVQGYVLATLPGVPPEIERYGVIVLAAGTAIFGCVVVVLPWLTHPARSQADRQAELIAETKADMAAHLHDSVLQTLAIIQKRAADAKAVQQLARAQERELREWLYGDPAEDESATTALKDVAAELEATYPVTIQLVTVGDHDMTVEVDAMVRAAREAMLNAAKHSGADKIDVYAEITAVQADVYVRDRGKGFKLADIGDDRMGIRGSIVERMERFGGTVDIRSTVGEGTEIHLAMRLDQEGEA